MTHNFFGRCVLPTKLGPALLFCVSSLAAHAAPLDQLEGDMALVFEHAQSAWAESLISQGHNMLPLDEQIFTDLSPILDSPQSIKLPPDQLLTD